MIKIVGTYDIWSVAGADNRKELRRFAKEGAYDPREVVGVSPSIYTMVTDSTRVLVPILTLEIGNSKNTVNFAFRTESERNITMTRILQLVRSA